MIKFQFENFCKECFLITHNTAFIHNPHKINNISRQVITDINDLMLNKLSCD